MKCAILIVCSTFLIESINAALRPRIIGGSDANVKDFPYQVAIRIRDKHTCGGTIISDRHVLTAAHCFTHPVKRPATPPYNNVRIYTGISDVSETGHTYRVQCVDLHPRWEGTDESSFVNDISVVTLKSEIVFYEKQQKANLPSRNVVSGTKGYVTGWGRTSGERGCKPSAQMQKLQMTLLTNKDCQPSQASKIYENQLCASQTMGHGSCLGDSGGPIVVNNEVVGIISWVHQRKFASGIPEVFTNVYAHLDFIRAVLNRPIQPDGRCVVL